MTATYEPPQPNAALVVGPDDLLVLSLPRDTSPADFNAFVDGIADRHPALKHRVLIVVGLDDLAVVKR